MSKLEEIVLVRELRGEWAGDCTILKLDSSIPGIVIEDQELCFCSVKDVDYFCEIVKSMITWEKK